MPYVVTGSPLGPFADAVLTALAADGNLTAIVADRIVATPKTGTRTTYPYIVGDRRDLAPGSVAMQKEGGEASLWIHCWSELNDPDEVQRMQARVRAVLNRSTALAITGYVMYAGSLHIEEEMVISDFDQDMPQRSLYHGVQRVVADLEEAA